jgi:hypothetical protein
LPGENISIPVRQPITQPAELFKLSDLMRYWNSDLSEFAGETVTLRLYQRVLVPYQTAGNAYWNAIQLK